jgi:hypothetical protein
MKPSLTMYYFSHILSSKKAYSVQNFERFRTHTSVWYDCGQKMYIHVFILCAGNSAILAQ